MTVLIIGGSGLIGSAVTEALTAVGHDVIAVTRHSSPAVDVTDPESIQALFDRLGQVSAVVCTLGEVPFRPLGELSREDYLAAFTGKVLCQLDVVRIGAPFVRDGGSFTLTSGILAREPIPSGTAAGMANGALESFVVGAAAELPRGIRINVVSPSVLAEAESYHSAFPGFERVPAAACAQAYIKSVDGVQTGRVFIPNRI